MRIISFLFFSLILSFSASAQTLLCVNRQSGDVLTWLPAAPVCANFNGYIVFGSTSATGPYLPLDTFPSAATTTYTHTAIGSGSTVWWYYIVSDCGGVLSIPNDTLDSQVPVTPRLASASVENGVTVLTWMPSPSPETAFYVVYAERPPGSGFDSPLDTVSVTTYTHTTALVTTQSEQYRIAAMDLCDELGLKCPPHRTMFLNQTTDACTRLVTLSWTPYVGWDGGIARQEVMVSVNGGAFSSMATLAGNSTTYTFTANDGEALCIYIEAFENGTTYASKSNEVCFTPQVLRPMDYAILENVSVNAAGGIDLTWNWDTDANLNATFVERDNVFLQSVALPAQTDNTYLDATTLYDASSLTYKVASVNICGDTLYSNAVPSLFLNGTALDNFTNVLQWTPYTNTYGSLLRYELYRVVNGVASLASNITSGQRTASDAVNTNDPAEENVCYYVIARARITLPDGTQRTIESRSNTVCLTQKTVLWLPNAFAPGTVNSEFRAVTVFGATADFNMQIYDRWGNRVFETDNIETPWTGLAPNGSALPQGMYAYTLRLVQTDGKSILKQGTVMLLR